MDFDPRDYDSRDGERGANAPSQGARGASDHRNREDHWRQPDARLRDHDEGDVRTPGRGPGNDRQGGDEHARDRSHDLRAERERPQLDRAKGAFLGRLSERPPVARTAPPCGAHLDPPHRLPRPVDRFYDAYQTVVHEELESPLHPATISALRWYFEHCQKAAAGPVHPLTQRLESGAKLFGTPRFTQMYRRWLKHGDSVFDGAESAVLAEALNAGRGRVESLVLPHAYRHLSPLVDHTPSRAAGVEKGEQEGAHWAGTSSTPSPNPFDLDGGFDGDAGVQP